MFLTQKHLSRRTVLRGMGATIALPLLDAMIPVRTALAKTAAAPVSRLACIEMVHGAAGSSADGIVKHYWSPAKEGADFEVTPTLSPLETFRDYVTIVSAIAATVKPGAQPKRAPITRAPPPPS